MSEKKESDDQKISLTSCPEERMMPPLKEAEAKTPRISIETDDNEKGYIIDIHMHGVDKDKIKVKRIHGKYYW